MGYILTYGLKQKTAIIRGSGGARGHPDEGAAFPDGGAEKPKAAAALSQRGMGRKLAVLLHLESLE